jgi:hypothetical protein
MIIVGIISIIFFGFALLIILRKIFDKRPGFVIDDVGIIDRSTGFSDIRVKWENINNFKRYNLVFIQFIAVIVDNYDEYIKLQKYKIFNFMAKMDHKITGSPINIYLNVLRCKPKNIEIILKDELKKRKKNN